MKGLVKVDVFISYSSKNKSVADAVVSDFEQHGVRCWYAPRDIMPGKEWVTAIKEGIHSAKVFVLLFTEESNTSRQVMNEVAMAFNAEKTIVPFKLTEKEMSDELEYYLTRVHWLDAVSKPLKDQIDELRKFVELILSGSNPKATLNRELLEKNDGAGNNDAVVPDSGNKTKPGIIILLSAIAVLLVVIIILMIVKPFGLGNNDTGGGTGTDTGNVVMDAGNGGENNTGNNGENNIQNGISDNDGAGNTGNNGTGSTDNKGGKNDNSGIGNNETGNIDNNNDAENNDIVNGDNEDDNKDNNDAGNSDNNSADNNGTGNTDNKGGNNDNGGVGNNGTENNDTRNGNNENKNDNNGAGNSDNNSVDNNGIGNTDNKGGNNDNGGVANNDTGNSDNKDDKNDNNDAGNNGTGNTDNKGGNNDNNDTGKNDIGNNDTGNGEDQGTSTADYHKMGKDYLTGTDDCEADEDKALYYLELAYNDGNGEKMTAEEFYFLAYKYDSDASIKDPKKVYTYALKGAEAGNVSCMIMLGEAYWYGNGVDIDYEQVLLWFGKALDSGIEGYNKKYCINCITSLVEEGHVDPDAASKWIG